jgi:tellurite methyltransferase
MMSVVEFWNKIYRDLDAPVAFGGGQPSAELVEAVGYLTAGARAIDIGCGDGRNSLFLAERGCSVEAVDISPVAIAQVKRFAEERSVTVEARVQDVRHIRLETDYDLVTSMGCLHLIEREYWQPVLRQIQDHTCAGGYNAIGVFTNTLPAPDDQRDHFVGLFNEGELFDCYADWEIVTQRSWQFHDQHPGSIRHHHAANTILARKVSSRSGFPNPDRKP